MVLSFLNPGSDEKVSGFLCRVVHVCGRLEAAVSMLQRFIVASFAGVVLYDLQEKAAFQATKSEGYQVASYYTSEEDSQHIHV